MRKLKRIITELFCRHDYEKVGWREECSSSRRWSVRNYVCRKCGKSVWVDGRYDHIGR